jgi:tRNA-dihydrouridine synthase 2
VILQIGTSNAERAVKVAKIVENDVAAIDINMGCPKSFSVKGGMGAALAANIENAKKILSALKNAVKIPITCKIRIKKTIEDTILHVKELEMAGIDAIAIHARTRDERPPHPPHPEFIKAVVDSGIKIPVICNGFSKEITKHSDIQRYKDICGSTSIMLARAAEWNVSIFRPQGLLPIHDIIKMYLKYAIDYDNTVANTKYNIQNILLDKQETEQGKRFLASETMKQICEVFGEDIKEYYQKKQLELRERINKLSEEPQQKKIKLSNGNKNDDDDIIFENITYSRSNYLKDTELPKSLLHLYAKKNLSQIPKYTFERKGNQFRAILHLDGKKYSSTVYDKNKKSAEQCACLCALTHLKLVTREELIENRSLNRYQS